MVIGITGYGATGASAYVDLLREFDNVQSFDSHAEFQLLQQPDGIRDLRFNLVESRRRISINCAIHRFIKQYKFKRNNTSYNKVTKGKYTQLSEKYINSLIQMTWKGKSIYDPQDILKPIEKDSLAKVNNFIRRIIHIFDKCAPWPPMIPRYYSYISTEDFIAKTKTYLSDFFQACEFDLNNPIMLEQLFCLENPLEGSEYFDTETKSIIVDRDPRDVFLLTNGYLADNCSFMPNTGNVEDFVKYYKGLHSTFCEDPNVLYVNFEDLIYNYHSTVCRMEQFLGIKHVHPKSNFKPEWSINNTQVYKNYPQYEKEIKYIEEQLHDYLYPYESQEIDFVPEEIGLFDNTPGDAVQQIKKRKF